MIRYITKTFREFFKLEASSGIMLLLAAVLALIISNGTYSDADRAQLQSEVDQLTDELTRIADTTTFNGQNILDGSYSGNMSITDDGQGGINVEIGSVSAALLGGRADGPAEAAALATISFGGVTTEASDYHGASFDVAVDGVTANVNLPTSNGINPTGAVAATDFAGEARSRSSSVHQLLRRQSLWLDAPCL